MEKSQLGSRALLPKQIVLAPQTSIAPLPRATSDWRKLCANSHDLALHIPKKRKPKAASVPGAEWARIKDPFARLYIEEDMELTDVMKLLEKEFGFRAT